MEALLCRKPFFPADLCLFQYFLEKANSNVLLMWVGQVYGQIIPSHKIRMWPAAEKWTFETEHFQSPNQILP